MSLNFPNSQSMRVGVVMRRSPGVTRWAKWAWKAVSVIPGAPDADWKELLRQGDITDFHAATHDLWLYVSDTEAYVHELAARVPSVYVVLRTSTLDTPAPWQVLSVTASPYEAQDYADSGEEVVEKVPMPSAVLAWVRDFVEQYHVEEEFVKRRRDKARVDRRDDGIGDSRIAQVTDVYRAPGHANREVAE